MDGDRKREIVERVTELRKALADSQRNHHRQMMLFRKGVTTHHGAHWQHCQSPSCQLAARAHYGDPLALVVGL